LPRVIAQMEEGVKTRFRGGVVDSEQVLMGLRGEDGSLNEANIQKFLREESGMTDPAARALAAELVKDASGKSLAVVVASTRELKGGLVDYFGMEMRLVGASDVLNPETAALYQAAKQKGFGSLSTPKDVQSAVRGGQLTQPEAETVLKARKNFQVQQVVNRMLDEGSLVVEDGKLKVKDADAASDFKKKLQELVVKDDGDLAAFPLKDQEAFAEKLASGELGKEISQHSESIRLAQVAALKQVLDLAAGDPTLTAQIKNAITNRTISIICGCP